MRSPFAGHPGYIVRIYADTRYFYAHDRWQLIDQCLEKPIGLDLAIYVHCPCCDGYEVTAKVPSDNWIALDEIVEEFCV